MNYVVLIGILLSLTSCRVEIPNIEVCGKLPEGGYCAYTLSGPEREIDESKWDELGRVSMDAESFGKLKKFILESCKRSRKCKEEHLDEMRGFLRGF